MREIEARHAAAEHALERQIAALRADEPQRMQQLRAEQEQVCHHSWICKPKNLLSFFLSIKFLVFARFFIKIVSNLYSRNALPKYLFCMTMHDPPTGQGRRGRAAAADRRGQH